MIGALQLWLSLQIQPREPSMVFSLIMSKLLEFYFPKDLLTEIHNRTSYEEKILFLMGTFSYRPDCEGLFRLAVAYVGRMADESRKQQQQQQQQLQSSEDVDDRDEEDSDSPQDIDSVWKIPDDYQMFPEAEIPIVDLEDEGGEEEEDIIVLD